MMLKKSFILVIIIFITLLSTSVVSASKNTLEILDNTHHNTINEKIIQPHNNEDSTLKNSNNKIIKDNKNILTPSGNKFTDIQDSINSAKENDKIELNGRYCGYKPININKSLTFNGINFAELNGKCVTVIINNTAKNIVFNNIRIINGYDKDRYVSYGNPATGENGTIRNTGGITFNNCTFIKNLPHYYSYDNKYEYAINNYGKIIFNKCSFNDNFNTIYSKGTCNIYTSNFTNSNNIYSNGELNIENCKFYKADGSGTNYLIKVKNESIIKNCEFNKCTFSEREISPTLIYIVNGNHTIINTQFINSKFEISYDNLIRTYTNKRETIKILNSQFINNKVPYNALITHYGSGKLILENTIFKNTTSSPRNHEGTIFQAGGTVIIKNKDKTKTYKSNKENSLSQHVFDDSFKPYPYYIIKIPKKTISFNFNDNLTIQAYYGYTKNPGYGPYLHLYIEKGDSFKSLGAKDGYDNGIVNFNLPKLPPGVYKIKIKQLGDDCFEYITTIKITKAQTIIQAPSVTAKKGKSKYFKITLKHKNTKKTLSGIKLKVKIYTNKKYKTYTLTTNKKGITQLNTNKLKKGNHKVIIQSENKNYIISAKSNIKIK